MARRKSKANTSGGGSLWGLLFFLVVIGCVVAAFLYLRDKDNPLAPSPQPRAPVVGTSPSTTPTPTRNPGQPERPTPAPDTPRVVQQTPSPTPTTPAIPRTNKLETGIHDVEEPILAPKSHQERLADIGPLARQRLKADFAKAGVSYPPTTVVLCGLKKERSLEVWAGDDPDNFHPIKAYHILDVSGQLGPKLREGDKQIPEGVYRITTTNPNSKYYLSLLLDYPNDMDRTYAARDGRSNLGGDICIHGGQSSFSTIPVGTEAAEELFALVADTGTRGVKVILAPCDLRKGLVGRPAGSPPWTDELYRHLREQMLLVASRGG